MQDVIVVIGAGQIGQAIARRVGVGKCVLLADLHQDNATAAADVLLNVGYKASATTVDASSRDAVHALAQQAAALGNVTGLIHAAGRFSHPGFAGNDPQSGFVWHGAGA
jgi:NAD(P)-dependent dehydrogenase (short-subunit alcohol dehydrogenase family)